MKEITQRESKLKLRMFHLNLYSISAIQHGIQAYHAGMEWLLKYGFDDDLRNWLENEKTVIVLNGGTSNDEGKDYYFKQEYWGTLQVHREFLMQKGIKFTEFHEPDINNTLTSIGFLLDERIWDRTNYPNLTFEDACIQLSGQQIDSENELSEKEFIRLAMIDKYGEYVVEMREWINKFDLAR